MKNKRYAKFSTDDLRSVFTILEKVDGTIIVMMFDRITGMRHFVDEIGSEALVILDKEGIALF
jgi:hypothetical protein